MNKMFINKFENYILRLFFKLVFVQIQTFIVTIYEFLNTLIVCMNTLISAGCDVHLLTPSINFLSLWKLCVAGHFFYIHKHMIITLWRVWAMRGWSEISYPNCLLLSCSIGLGIVAEEQYLRSQITVCLFGLFSISFVLRFYSKPQSLLWYIII